MAVKLNAHVVSPRSGQAFAVIAGCLVALVTAWLLASRNQLVEIDLHASAGGFARLQWTTPGHKFTLDRSVVFRVAPERHRYRVLVQPQQTPFHLQLKFPPELAAPGVHSLSVERVGRRRQTFDATNLEQRFQRTGNRRRPQIRDRALFLSGGAGESQMRFDSLHRGDRQKTATGLMVAAMATLGMLTFLLARFGLLARFPVRYSVAALALFAWLPLAAAYLPLWLIVSVRAVSIGSAVAFGISYWWRDRTQALHGARWRALLAGGFAVSIFLFGAGLLPTLPGFDIRSLASVSTDDNRRGDFDVYIEEQFPSRAALIEYEAGVKVFGLGISSSPKVIFGDDGFMFEGRGQRRVEGDDVRLFDNVSDFLGRIPFTEAELASWAQTLTERRDWLRQQGIPYLFVLAPTKDMVYGDKLPARLRRHGGQQRRYDQLISYLDKNTDVPVLDLRPRLQRERNASAYPELYYRTDFHWNFLGSFLAYEEIVRTLNDQYPQLALSPLVRDDFDIVVDENWSHPRFLRTLGLDPKKHETEHYLKLRPRNMARFPNTGIIPEDGIQDVPWPTEKLGTGDRSINVRTIRNPNGKLPMVVVYGDSFIEKSLLYLSVHAKHLVFQRAVFEFPVDVFLAGQKPDLVIQEVLNMYILRDAPTNEGKFDGALK